MKSCVVFLLVLCYLSVPCAHAAFYQWEDAGGVVHFTDNTDKIPPKYRKKAKKLKLMEEPAAVKEAAPVQQPPPAQASPRPPEQEMVPGGHPEPWWRARFASLRNELKTLEQSLSQKQGKLVELRRKRAIYFRAQDREAVNAMQEAISADEAKMTELLKSIDAFDREATQAGVPSEWRQ